jgi:hypothetical protein
MPHAGYAALLLLELFALGATLRLSFAPRRRPASAALRALTHAGWLVPLILIVWVVLGMYVSGSLSPWPPAAFAAQRAAHGFWAGAAAGTAALVADLWLLVTPAQVMLRFGRAEHAVRYRAFNLAAGSVVLAIAAAR